ncbi:hypothetical protein HFO30_36120 [Rhizobium laguerreae]|nr:hypothetical protein [Rhizobium laguerreae]
MTVADTKNNGTGGQLQECRQRLSPERYADPRQGVRRSVDPVLAQSHGTRALYPKAREQTVTADCCGSNGACVRLSKLELPKLADETGLILHVHHYPLGTSK